MAEISPLILFGLSQPQPIRLKGLGMLTAKEKISGIVSGTVRQMFKKDRAEILQKISFHFEVSGTN